MTGTANHPQAQPGFTLVEILVAMTLGLLLVLVVVQVYVANNRASRFNDALGILQENGRFSLSFLRKAIEMSGYNDPDTPFTPHLSGHPVAGTDGPDTLTVYYEGGAGIRDCTGADIAAGAGVSDVFSMSAGGLVCNGSAEPVVSGIDDMQVLYGIDDDADTVPNRFVRAGQVVGGGGWENVIAVRVGLLLRTDAEVAGGPDGNTYWILDQSYGPPGDRRVRELFTTTVRLRN